MSKKTTVLVMALIMAFILSVPAVIVRAEPAPAPAPALTQEQQDELKAVRWLLDSAGISGEFADADYMNPFHSLGGVKPLNVKVDGAAPSGIIKMPLNSKAVFSFDPAAFISSANISSFAGGAFSNMTFHSMHHAIAFTWDGSRVGVKNPDSGASQPLTFGFVTDPITLKVTTFAFFKFQYLNQSQPKWCFALEANQVLVIDEMPPDSVYYSDRVLFTTTGGKMSEFNKRVEDYGFKHPNSALKVDVKNPENLTIMFKDNNFFSSYNKADIDKLDPKPHRFGVTPLDFAFYVETYKAFYKESDNPTSANKLERMIGETVDSAMLGSNPATPEGRFGWMGPIWVKDLEGWTFEAWPMETEGDEANEKLVEPKIVNGIYLNKDKLCTVVKMTGPLKSLETAVEKLTGDPNSMRYSLHFASYAQMYIPAAEGDNARYLEHQLTDEEMGFKEEKMLRICTAALDSSGNLRMPWLSRSIDEKKVLADFQAKYGAEKMSKAGLCDEMIAVIPYDDRLPGAVLSVTNTETNITTSFTIPNSDCLTKENADAGSDIYFPFAEQAEVWHFKYDGDTDAMKWLKQKDPKRYDEYIKALSINEDVRLIFDMAAYDNVNKYFETLDTDTKKIGQYGISTEMTGAEKGVENLHYKTWQIDDPTGTESLMYENKADKLFVYPDYMFRNPEQGKVYKVSFYVEDFSPFFNSKGSAVNPQPDKRSGNIRQIILEFDVKGRAVQSHSMGGTTTTTNTVLDKTGGENK